MTDPTAAEVAASLSKAQREAVELAREKVKGEFWILTPQTLTIEALWRRGIASHFSKPAKLTRFGLAVRAELISETPAP
jgi:hypothetical protein